MTPKTEQEVDNRCPTCECPLSRILNVNRLLKGRHGAIIVRTMRQCEHCQRTFWTRVEEKGKAIG